jgi:hypothetical protein
MFIARLGPRRVGSWRMELILWWCFGGLLTMWQGFKGEKPADLPVRQSTKVELMNLTRTSGGREGEKKGGQLRAIEILLRKCLQRYGVYRWANSGDSSGASSATPPP